VQRDLLEAFVSSLGTYLGFSAVLSYPALIAYLRRKRPLALIFGVWALVWPMGILMVAAAWPSVDPQIYGAVGPIIVYLGLTTVLWIVLIRRATSRPVAR